MDGKRKPSFPIKRLKKKKNKTPREVVYFPEVTQLVGSRFLSWALEASQYE